MQNVKDLEAEYAKYNIDPYTYKNETIILKGYLKKQNWYGAE